MSERRGPKALELWCRRITDGYPGVNVQNMTTSWRDGLAFCAMIHHFRPDLIDFNSLNKDDVYGNNELAFRTAEQHLGIPALLDAEDMASCSVPDRLSILTYLSQFYQHFGGSSPSRLAMSRSSENTSQGMTPVPESPQPKVAPRLGMRREVCSVCGMPVFLAEKLVISRRTYHRTCFRCARCMNQLTPGNYYETEEGQYCCETCPDEDSSTPKTSTINETGESSQYPKSLNFNEEESFSMKNPAFKKSLSDEEKTLNSLKDLEIGSPVSLQPLKTLKTSKMRLNFMENQLLSEHLDSLSPDASLLAPHKSSVPEEYLSEDVDTLDQSLVANINDLNDKQSVAIKKINLSVKESVEEECQDTKETLGVGDTDDRTSKCLSIVQQRLKMFEKSSNSSEQCDSSDFHNAKNSTEKLTKSARISRSSQNPQNADISSDKFSEIENDNSKIIKSDFNGTNAILENSQIEISILSASGIDLSAEVSKEYPDEMNPFESGDEMEENVEEKGFKKLDSTNPFGSDDDDDDDDINVNDNNEKKKKPSHVPPKPAARSTAAEKSENIKESVKIKLKAPQINLNPFWSDDEEPDSEEDVKDSSQTIAVPVPKPRTLKQSETSGCHLKLGFERPDFYASNTSLASMSSTTTPGGTSRKKKPAPPPPPTPNKRSSPSSTRSSMRSSNLSLNVSNRSTPKLRKLKPAPPPPMPLSTPFYINLPANSTINDSPIDSKHYESCEDEKIVKNEANKTVKRFSSPSPDDCQDYLFMDKSSQGKWKRKKGPAPARPVSQQRKIKVMSAKDVKVELDEIEVQQQGLEKQGVRLEQLIRDRCETGTHNDENLTLDAEELVLELFSLVNEKNELFRRQSELMLLKRQQRFEEEYADVEYQIRCLMCQPEATKTDFDKQREEKLIQRLIEIVERRSEIIECLEMDRRREVEEDKSINMHMGLYAAKSKGDLSKDCEELNPPRKTKKLKIKEIIKENPLKKSHKKDADKDVDETEVKLKRQIKKKWF